MHLNDLYPYKVPDNVVVPAGEILLRVAEDGDSVYTTLYYRDPEMRKDAQFFSRKPFRVPLGSLKVAPEASGLSFALWDGQAWMGYGNGGSREVNAWNWPDAKVVPLHDASDEDDKSSVEDKEGDIWYWRTDDRMWETVTCAGNVHRCPSKQEIRAYTGGELNKVMEDK